MNFLLRGRQQSPTWGGEASRTGVSNSKPRHRRRVPKKAANKNFGFILEKMLGCYWKNDNLGILPNKLWSLSGIAYSIVTNMAPNKVGETPSMGEGTAFLVRERGLPLAHRLGATGGFHSNAEYYCTVAEMTFYSRNAKLMWWKAWLKR